MSDGPVAGWTKVQLREIIARRTKSRIDRAMFWAAKWENGQRDGMFEGHEYAAQDHCVVLANEVERLRELHLDRTKTCQAHLIELKRTEAQLQALRGLVRAYVEADDEDRVEQFNAIGAAVYEQPCDPPILLDESDPHAQRLIAALRELTPNCRCGHSMAEHQHVATRQHHCDECDCKGFQKQEQP